MFVVKSDGSQSAPGCGHASTSHFFGTLPSFRRAFNPCRWWQQQWWQFLCHQGFGSLSSDGSGFGRIKGSKITSSSRCLGAKFWCHGRHSRCLRYVCCFFQKLFLVAEGERLEVSKNKQQFCSDVQLKVVKSQQKHCNYITFCFERHPILLMCLS